MLPIKNLSKELLVHSGSSGIDSKIFASFNEGNMIPL